MKLFIRNIKKGFATNSSSYHTMIMMTEEQKQKWEKGEIEIEGYSHDEWYDEESESEYDTSFIEIAGQKIYSFARFGSDY